MELWIRSQDKEILTKVNYLEAYGSSTNWWIMGNDNDLGTYKTKERALEVLNEIHQRLIDLQTLEIAPDSYRTIKRNINCVYEMPKE